MKKAFSIIVLFLLIFQSSFATTYSSDPQTFVQEMVNDAINTLSSKNLTDEEKANFIENLAIDNVDINALGLYTLGELRKSADKANLERYQRTFEKYFLKSLTSRLTDYSSNKFEVISSEKKSSNYTIVKSKIGKSENQPEIKIDWRIYTKNPEKPLIRDLIVEGLSLARTQKEEFASVIESNDGDVTKLFTTLKKFVANNN